MTAARRIRMVPHAELVAADERVSLAQAERDQLRESLKRIVKQLERISGYSTATEQAELRAARALLAEVGE